MKTPIQYPDFDKLEIRTGTIVSATEPQWSHKLLRFEVDFGEEIGKRIIFSGIRKWYTPEDFLGKQYIFLVNLEPKKMGDEESQGMMLMADGEKPVPLILPETVNNGEVVR
jgi:methionyl-tRNA synthetase